MGFVGILASTPVFHSHVSDLSSAVLGQNETHDTGKAAIWLTVIYTVGDW